MEKDIFFDKLHQELGNKYHLHPEFVGYLRHFVLGEKRPIDYFISRMQIKPTLPKRNSASGKGLTKFHTRGRAKLFYTENLSRFVRLSEENLKDLLQITKFDKQPLID